MMCFRCEHRARFLEDGRRPRCECGDITSSVNGCYMFRPCAPLVLNDERPIRKGVRRPPMGPWMIASRLYVDKDATAALNKKVKITLKRVKGKGRKWVALWAIDPSSLKIQKEPKV